MERGWRLNDPTVVIAADPAPFLAAPNLTVVIPTGASAINHRRILRPVLTGGLIVDLLLVDAAGNVQEHHVMPVDSTLADAPEITARFPDPLTFKIDQEATPSAACMSCHASAHAAWAGSKHARALESLKPADRTDSCIGCHTTPTADKVLAPGVGCQACHTGSAAHVATAGTAKTTGAVDCRSCHDAKHHPAFDREKAWKVILHGSNP
jgi:hypothetical protein